MFAGSANVRGSCAGSVRRRPARSVRFAASDSHAKRAATSARFASETVSSHSLRRMSSRRASAASSSRARLRLGFVASPSSPSSLRRVSASTSASALASASPRPLPPATASSSAGGGGGFFAAGLKKKLEIGRCAIPAAALATRLRARGVTRGKRQRRLGVPTCWQSPDIYT
eukprot:31405-Pelagococcus_subviridis.AAC.6